MPRTVLGFEEIGSRDVARVGGKNASLGELTQHLGPRGIRVPPGFAVTTEAFRLHLDAVEFEARLGPALRRLDPRDLAALRSVAGQARELIASAPLPESIERELRDAYEDLCRRIGRENADVAVRSSATAEDLPEASFAGQQETYLNVRGFDAVERATRNCMASLFTDRAISYRAKRGFGHEDVQLSVGIQQMVRSDRGSAGVIFTLDPESGFRQVVVLTSSFGLGESVVQGRVTPDEVVLHKPALREGRPAIIRRKIGEKRIELVYGDGHGETTVREVELPEERRQAMSVSDDDATRLARWALEIEDHYSKNAGHPVPLDIEWAKDGITGELFIVQARPETVHARHRGLTLDTYRLKQPGHVLLRGIAIGDRIGAGRVHVAQHVSELHSFEDGEVLVAPMTDPDWEPVLARASAVITDQGGRTCHAAIVCRELGVPCVVGTGRAVATLSRDGAPDAVTVSCADGEVGKVLQGKLGFEKSTLDLSDIPEPRIPVMLNVGNPELAFRAGQLPSAGVGLARMEFIVSNWIGVHPMALLHPDRVKDESIRREVLERARGFEQPWEYFVQSLESGVAQIAAAFHPRPVILRFSDFKTNEYAGLLGGADFEAQEANPMLGFRGASRYYDERYREAFALECEAVRRVRSLIGLTNLKVMVPFCRTIDEAERVLDEMGKNGLERGKDDLEVYVMCEIPNNVILAREFSKYFDGFSIGSNDLTQLTLGVDRDSEGLRHIFDEQDPGVKRMIEMVVRSAHQCGRKVGLCGQGPSDFPEFADFLADLGIDSISVTTDALAPVLKRLASSASASVAPARTRVGGFQHAAPREPPRPTPRAVASRSPSPHPPLTRGLTSRGAAARGPVSRAGASTPTSRGPQSRGPQSRGPQSRGPQSRGPQSRGPQSRGPQSQFPGSRGPGSQTPRSGSR